MEWRGDPCAASHNGQETRNFILYGIHFSESRKFSAGLRNKTLYVHSIFVLFQFLSVDSMRFNLFSRIKFTCNWVLLVLLQFIIYSNIGDWQLIVYESGQLIEPLLCVLTNYKPITNIFVFFAIMAIYLTRHHSLQFIKFVL